MPHAIRLASMLLLFGAPLCAGCKRDPSNPGPLAQAPSVSSAAPKAPEDHRDPGRLARIDPGMSEDEVRTLLGPPEEIRREGGQRPWIVGASAAWAYGNVEPGGFAFGGVVLFDPNARVLMTRSPIDPISMRARRFPWSEGAVRSDRGLSCRIEVIAADPEGIDVHVSLHNGGASTYERRHGHTGIAFDLLVELLDAGRHPIARYDTLSLFSPHAPDDTERMTIPPGGSIRERVRLGALVWSELGKLPAGSYLVRVAFPFETGHFTPSAPVPVQIER